MGEGSGREGLADIVSIHDIHKRIDQSDSSTRILADSAFSSGWPCVHAKDNSSAFAPFLADSGDEEQDDGFLG